jgi:small basic protein
MIFSVLMMAAIHVVIFKALPNYLRKILCCNLFLGTFCDFCLSGVILVFTGVAAWVGMFNLAGSCLFGVYLYFYRKRHGISGIRLNWRWKVFPYPEIAEKHPSDHWLL